MTTSTQRRLRREATVADVMTSEVYAVAADTSIETACRLLATRHFTGAPVVSKNGRPIGVVTLADLVDPDRDRSQSHGYPLYYRVVHGHRVELGDGVAVGIGRVADVMSPFVLSIHASASLADAARTMVHDRVHRLLVVTDGKLSGIVTVTDLLRGLVGMGPEWSENFSPVSDRDERIA
jgi:CBS domain-containing protein